MNVPFTPARLPSFRQSRARRPVGWLLAGALACMALGAAAATLVLRAPPRTAVLISEVLPAAPAPAAASETQAAQRR